MREKTGRNSKSMVWIIAKIGLWLVIGGAVGYFSAFLMMSLKGNTYDVMNLFFYGYLKYALECQIGFFAVLGGIGVACFVKAGKQMRLGTYEAEDKAGEYQNAAMTVNELNMIIQFLLFGLAMDKKNPMMIGSAVIFVICCLFIIIMEALVVKQIKKMQPLKQGDVGEARFAQKWLDSCDEAERMVVYKASYNTFTVMKTVLPCLEAAAFFGKVTFGTGNFPIVLICIAWAVNTGVYCFYSMRLEKGNNLTE